MICSIQMLICVLAWNWRKRRKRGERGGKANRLRKHTVIGMASVSHVMSGMKTLAPAD